MLALIIMLPIMLKVCVQIAIILEEEKRSHGEAREKRAVITALFHYHFLHPLLFPAADLSRHETRW